MKKALTMTAAVATAVLTLSACTDSSTNAGADATGISDEQLAAPDEIDIPLRVTHLRGQVEPDHVSILCAGDQAFLHTWTVGRAGGRNVGNATTVRFAEHDELCAQAQS